MNDKIKINLQMADANFPITINRSDEEIMRLAARQVDIRLSTYRGHYHDLSREQAIAMVAFQFALDCLRLKERNDTEPFTTKIKELTEMLDDYFKQV